MSKRLGGIIYPCMLPPAYEKNLLSASTYICYLRHRRKLSCQPLHHCSEVHDHNSLAQRGPRRHWRCLETSGMRSVLSARHEKRAHGLIFCRRTGKRTVCRTGGQPSRALLAMSRNSSQLLAGGIQAKALLCLRLRLCFCGCE